MRRITLALLIVLMPGAVVAADAQTAVSPSAANTAPNAPGPVTSLPHANDRMPTGAKACVQYSTQSAARVSCAPGGIVWIDRAIGQTFRPGTASFGQGGAGYYTCARVTARACSAR